MEKNGECDTTSIDSYVVYSRERVTGVNRQIYPAARGLLVNVPADGTFRYQWISNNGQSWYCRPYIPGSTYETPGPLTYLGCRCSYVGNSKVSYIGNYMVTTNLGTLGRISNNPMYELCRNW